MYVNLSVRFAATLGVNRYNIYQIPLVSYNSMITTIDFDIVLNFKSAVQLSQNIKRLDKQHSNLKYIFETLYKDRKF